MLSRFDYYKVRLTGLQHVMSGQLLESCGTLLQNSTTPKTGKAGTYTLAAPSLVMSWNLCVMVGSTWCAKVEMSERPAVLYIYCDRT